MVFERIIDFVTGREPTEGESLSQEKEGDGVVSDGPSRPKGWRPMYGTYEKPVYPMEYGLVKDAIESVDSAADYVEFDMCFPEIGTNKNHIQLHLYTIEGEGGKRRFVSDVHISDFSEWLPEEAGSYSYPEDLLGENGPYYMNLEKNLTDLLSIHRFEFTLIEYSEAEDVAIFSAERELITRE